MNLERYQQLIEADYRSLQQQYVLQDAEAVSASVRLQEKLLSERRLSDYLSLSDSTKDNSQKEPQQKVETYKVISGLRQFAKQHVLLVGKPGSGKTTALRKLLLEESQQQEQLVILIELRRFETSVLDIAHAFTEAHELGLSIEELQRQLDQGRCLLLLDGTNELPSGAAQADLEAFLKTYKSCQVVATTRDIELGGDVGIKKKLELQPLTPEQVEAFIHAYIEGEEQSAEMIRQLQSRLKDFQETPLLLLMLCFVFKKYNRIPKNLGTAFRDCARIYDELFKQGIEKISYCRDLLSYLAFRMQTGRDRLNPLLEVSEEDAIRWLAELTTVEDAYGWAKDWLRFLRQYHLLLRRGDGYVEFTHQLWQDYYAAEYLLKYLPERTDEEIKCDFLNLLKWTEPLKLMQLLGNNQTQVLRIARLGLDTDLRLGALLSGAVCREFGQQSMEQLKTYPFLIRWWRIDRRIWRLPQTKPLLLLLILRIAATSNAISYITTTLLKSKESPVRRRAAEVLGRIGDRSAVAPLIDMLGDSESFVRRHAAEALGRIGDRSAVVPLIDVLFDSNNPARSNAAEALGRIGDHSAVVSLLEVLGDSEDDGWVRASVAEALGRIGDRLAVVPLLEALGDSEDDGWVRASVAEALGRIGDRLAVVPLLEALGDSEGDGWVRARAAGALGRIGDRSAVVPLLEALGDSNSSVRSSAADALGQIGDRSAVVPLVEALMDSDQFVRSSAAAALGRIGDRSAAASLIETLGDSDSSARRCAAEGLFWIGNRSAVVPLIESLGDSDGFVRWSVAEALGRIGDRSAVAPLLEVLGNSEDDGWVRARAAEALGRIGDRSAVVPLLEALENSNVLVCTKAAIALSQIGERSAVTPLLAMLSNDSDVVRWSAATALGQVGSEGTIEQLWYFQLQAKSLYREDNYMDEIAAIQNRCKFYNNNLYRQGAYNNRQDYRLTTQPNIPPLNPSTVQAHLNGSIGALNIHSVVNGSAIGTQTNDTSSGKDS